MSRRPLGTPLSFPLAPGDSGTETRAIWVGRYQLSRAECFFCFPLFFLSYFFLVLFWGQGLTVYPWLSQNSSYRPGWPQANKNMLATASTVLGLKSFITMPGL